MSTITLSTKPGARYLTKAGGRVIGNRTDLNRETILVNDESCPLDIRQGSFSLIERDYEVTVMFPVDLYARAEVTAFEVCVLSFDLFGRLEHRWALMQAVKYGKGEEGHIDLSVDGALDEIQWNLSMAYVISRARLADGSIWKADMQAVDAAIKEAGFEY